MCIRKCPLLFQWKKNKKVRVFYIFSQNYKGLVATCHSFLHFIFSFIWYSTEHGRFTKFTSYNFIWWGYSVYERNWWSILITSHTVVVKRLGQAGFMHGTGGLKVTVSSRNFGLSPQLGLEPAPHTSEALVERYLNGSQLILGNGVCRLLTFSSLVVLSQIHCWGGGEL